jgi:serine/threonine-protein kinase
LLYECVTGRVPFDGDNFNDLMFKIALAPRPNPLEFCPDLSIPLASIIIKAISADPRERFASAAEFHAALVEWLDTQGVKSVRPPELRRALKATPRASGAMRAGTPAEAPAIVISAEAAHWSDATAAVPSQGATPLAAAATFEPPPPHPRSKRGVLATLGAALLIGTVAGAAALRHTHRQGPPGEAAQVPPLPIQAATTTAVPDPTLPPAVIAETRLEPPATAALPAPAAPRGVYRAPPRTDAHVGPPPKNTPSGPSESPPAPAKNMDSTATPAPVPPPPPPAPAAAEPPPKPADTVEGRAIRIGL